MPQTFGSAVAQLGMDGALAKKVEAQTTAPATSTTPGALALKGAAVANCTVAADGTSAGTQLNLLLAQLRLAGVIAP